MRRLLTTLTIVILLPLAAQGLEGDAHTPMQADFIQSFHLTLQESESHGQPTADPTPPETHAIPVRNLLPPPPSTCLGLDGSAWLATALTTLLSLTLLICGSIRKFRACYNAPRRKLRRQARHELNHLVHQDFSPEVALPYLRDFFALPPSATLEQVAKAAQKQNLTDLADACHDAEQKRFNLSDTDFQTLRKAIAKLLSCLLILCLTTAGMTAHCQWRHAELLAAQGDTQKALELFLELHDTGPQSPELSQNIATLIAVTGNTLSLPPPQAWKFHAQCLRQARHTPISPECLLPLLPPLTAALLWLLICRKFRCACGTALVTVAVAALFMGTLAPRLKLRKQAVAIPQATIHLTPDDGASTMATLQKAQLVTLEENTPPVNGKRLLDTPTLRGWCSQDCLMRFH